MVTESVVDQVQNQPYLVSRIMTMPATRNCVFIIIAMKITYQILKPVSSHNIFSNMLLHSIGWKCIVSDKYTSIFKSRRINVR
jgi:hypothetical protein